jgi:hypothetical protein
VGYNVEKWSALYTTTQKIVPRCIPQHGIKANSFKIVLICLRNLRKTTKIPALVTRRFFNHRITNAAIFAYFLNNSVKTPPNEKIFYGGHHGTRYHRFMKKTELINLMIQAL